MKNLFVWERPLVGLVAGRSAMEGIRVASAAAPHPFAERDRRRDLRDHIFLGRGFDQRDPARMARHGWE